MKVKDVKIGEVFNIENTPSYPKLKIEGGYVDMRDEIVNKRGNCDDKEATIMSVGDDLKEMSKWVEKLKLKYLKGKNE